MARIDSVIDQQSVQAELEFLESGLDGLFSQIKSFEGVKVKFEGTNSVRDLVNAQNDLKSSTFLLDQAYKQAETNKAKFNGTTKQMTDQVIKEAKATKDLAAAKLNEAKANEQNSRVKINEAKTAKEIARAKEIESRLVDRISKEKVKTEALTLKEIRSLEKLGNEYEQLKTKYTIASNTAKQLAVQEINLIAAHGKEAAVVKVAAQNTELATNAAKKYYDQLIKVEQSVGQSQRQVGQYSQATFALTQVLREAPAFANSFATGISGISNNVPMLVDQFKILRTELGSGFKAFKVLAGGLLSFSAILPIAFLLIQTYGKEISDFFKNVFSGKEKIDKLRESQELLNKTLSESSGQYAEAVKMVNELKINIDLAKQGLLSKEKVLKQYNESIGKTTGFVGDLDEAEKALVKNGDAYIKMTLYKAAATLALGEAAQKALDRQKNILATENNKDFVTQGQQGLEAALQLDKEYVEASQKYTEAFLAGRTKEADELEKIMDRRRKAISEGLIDPDTAKDQDVLENIAKDFQKRAAEISAQFKFNFFGDNEEVKKGADKIRKQSLDLFKFRMGLLIEEQKIIATFPDQSTAIKARTKQAELEKELIQGVAKFELAQADLTASEKKLIVEKEAEDLKQAVRDRELAITKIILESRKRLNEDLLAVQKAFNDEEQKEAAKKDAQRLKEKQISDLGVEFQVKIDNLKDSAEQEYKIQLDLYRKGKISKEQFETEIQNIEKKSLRESLELQVKYYQDLLLLSDLPVDKQIEAYNKLNDALRAIRKLDLDSERELVDEKRKLWKELYKSLEEFGVAYFDGQFEREKNAIQDQIDLVDQKKQKDIEAANQSILSTQEKASQIAIIEARANAQKEQLERKRRSVEEQQAKFERAKQIFDIGVETAKSLFKIKAQAAVLASNPATVAFAPMALAQIPILLGISALQIGAILARPIPRYEKGTDNAKPGLAIWGEKGRELMIDKKGNLTLSPDRPTLTQLMGGEKILPADITRDILNANNITALLSMKKDQPVKQRDLNEHLIRQYTDKVVRAIQDKPLTVVNHIHNDAAFHAYINQHIKS